MWPRLSRPPPRTNSGGGLFIMGATKLTCKECGADYGLEARYVCERCFGPLEVAYEHDIQDVDHSRSRIMGGPQYILCDHDYLPLEVSQTRNRNVLTGG